MEGMTRSVEELLYSGNHYKIPGYQRDYQWTAALWQGLVADILTATTSPDGAPPHWLGILLTSKSSDIHHPGPLGKIQYTVIDGQQRLTTLAIWVAALVHHATEIGENIDLSLDDLAKISVQESDKPAFQAVLGNSWRDKRFWSLQNHQIVKAYTYFRFILWLGQSAVAEEDPLKLPPFKLADSDQAFEDQWTDYLASKKGEKTPRGSMVDVSGLLTSTLQRLSIYSLVHDPASDESQAVIFDTLNGARQELEALDHVRNSLFVRIKDVEASALYKEYWYPAETALRKVSIKAMGPGRAFVYDYVISKGEKKRQKNISASRGFSHFATMTKGLRDSEVENFIKGDLVPAMLTWQVVVRTENAVHYDGVEVKFSEAACRHMTNIRDLSSGPANPVVLHYATGFVTGQVTEKLLVEALFLIENFLVRQILGSRPLSPLRSKLMDLMGTIDGDYEVETLKKALADSDWVSDADLKKRIRDEPLYGSPTPRAIGAIFRGIEISLSGSGAMNFVIGKKAGDYTIEHIYPQENSKWIADIEKWGSSVEAYESRKHTLGNLTVATREHNTAVGNRRFADKQSYPTVPGKAAPLSINKSWQDSELEEWTPELIQQRSMHMLISALEYWKTL